MVDPAIKAGDAVGAAKVFAPDIYFVTTGVPTMRSRQGETISNQLSTIQHAYRLLHTIQKPAVSYLK